MREAFSQGLRELGYVEGQNITLTRRIGEVSQFEDLAADLVRRKVDVIVAQHADATRAAMNATRTIPIVATFVDDAASEGYVASLERPGGNVTGVSGITLELGGKWLELVKETVPSAKRVLVFWNRQADYRFPITKNVDSAARSLGVDIKWDVLPAPRGWLEDRMRTPSFRQAHAFIVLPGISLSRNQTIAQFGLSYSIPGIFPRTDWDLERMGGLMAYGVNRFEQSRRAAYVVDKILKGAKPAELPVELPKSFELVINLKAAKEIGITIPARVLAWADRVIK